MSSFAGIDAVNTAVREAGSMPVWQEDTVARNLGASPARAADGASRRTSRAVMEAARRIASTEHRTALQGFATRYGRIALGQMPWRPGERIPLGSTASLIVSQKRR